MGTLSAQNNDGGVIDSVYVKISNDIKHVTDVLDIIEKQTSFNCLYTTSVGSLESSTPIISEGTIGLYKLLQVLEDKFSIRYDIQDRNIYLKLEHDDTNIQIQLSGTVTDEEGVPIYGVTIKVNDNVTQTNFDGDYSMNVRSGEMVTFSYLGMKTEKVEVTEANINMTLVPCAEILSEVMVTGYGTQLRKNVSTAIVKVKPEDFNGGIVLSPLDLIMGKVAGLTITNVANNPNGGVSIQLRGVTSIQGGTTPLIVIDGIPGGNLDLIQPNDIASFDILKDGAAAAVYGTRGNNGVILITTKQGHKGKATYEYATYFSKEFEDKHAKPDFLKAADWRKLIAQGDLSASLDHGASTDIWDALINKNNLSEYHTFATSGGGEDNRYRVSFYYNNFEGISKENAREEVGGRINFSQNGLQDKLMIQAGIAVNHNDANLLGGGNFGTVIDWNPTDPIYAEPSNSNPGKYGYYEIYGRYNPISRYSSRSYERQQLTLSATAKVSYEVLKNVKAQVFWAYQYDNYEDRYYRTTKDWTQYQEGSPYSGTGYAYKSNYLNYNKLLESMLRYSNTFGAHTVDALMGYGYQYETIEFFDVSNSGFTSDATEDWDIGSDNSYSTPTLSSRKEDNTLISFFSRINYSFKNRYFFQASWRYEGSSRFGANNKWGDFPAISGGWVITDEQFMKQQHVFSFLKIRTGFGITGNQDIDNYQSLASLSGGYSYPIYYDGVDEVLYYTTYGPAKNVNPDLKWEKKEEFDVGVDFGFLKNKLTGTIDYFSRTTKDVLYNYSAQLPSGVASTVLANVGSIKNSGVEITGNYTPIRNANFKWDVALTGSYQKSIVKSLSNDTYFLSEFETGNIGNPGSLGNAFLIKEGRPIGDYYGKEFAGFTDSGEWLFYKADGSIGTSSEVSDADNRIIGNGMPKYQASLINNISYKGFYLSVFLRGKFDYEILNTLDMFYGNPYIIGTSNVLQSALTTHKHINETPIYSSYYLEKGDFVKIDNVQIGYNFKELGFVSNLNLYLSVRNLYTITGYTGRDPEVDDTGLTPGMDDRSYYPRTKTFTFGLKASF
ncbi:SusC/RagA family TonB-linked outer membrane protein [Neptunitalea chrysea]|uniref:SusC/RagA family TonB-linked outer membrane protein n=1 Tax=Neptunitalea chrysea TaxID=1647581 RepID=A0A9W6B3Q3_9FLAO|nr:SusC/RagA family TonB-linked outer membrane protein [Neptunitalea chrysea]